MSIDLILSSETEASLTDNQLDQNFTAIQAAVNTLTTIPTTYFNTQLVLRLQKGSALTNEELDNNFLYLEGEMNVVRGNITALSGVVDANLSTVTAALLNKQNKHANLTALSAHTDDGVLVFNNGAFESRTITGSTHIDVTNGDGLAGNPVISIKDTVLTTAGNQIVANKTISGQSNTLTNIAMTSLVGVLPFSKGGTNATTVADARTNLDAVKRPQTNGMIVKVGDDATVGRSLEVGGVGLTITNADGVDGNPLIQINATSSNTPSSVVSRDGSGNFVANTITANLVGNISGNAATVTNGLYSTQSYNNPTWLTALAGSKVTGIPNSSLVNSSFTINGTSVDLGGSYSFDTGVSTNTASRIIKRDANGDFAAGIITASLNGNASTATSSQSSITAQRLQTPRTINGVSFDGSANITITDNNKLPLTGGTLSGFLNLHSVPLTSMHAATKGYVDSKSLSVTYGTLVLANKNSLGDVMPPSGKTMSNLAGFLPAMGSSYLARPQYTTNLMIVIDVSGSAGSDATYNGTSYADAYRAAAAAGKFLTNHYSALGTTNVCLVRQENANTGVYKWTSPAQALIDLNALMVSNTRWTGTTANIPSAFNFRPGNASQTVIYFLGDANHDITAGSAFGGSEAAWKTFLNQAEAVSYGVCVDNSGTASYLNEISWDGRSQVDLNGFRALTDNDLPTTYSPGLYNTGSIDWTAMADRIRVTLTNDSEVNNVAINWLALWN